MTDISAHFTAGPALLEQENHLRHAGFFFPAIDPLPTAPSSVTLHITCAFSASSNPIVIEGTIVQAFPGTGFAIAPGDADATRQALQPLFDAARNATAEVADDAGVDVSWGAPAAAPVAESENESGDPEADTEPGTGEGGTTYDRVRALSVRERMNLARSGGRAERTILIKDSNKTVHTFLVQNPRITLDEIKYMAGFRQTGPDALKMISENRTWLQNSGIVTALVRNPKTPATIAVRLLEKLPKAEIARLARSTSAPRRVVEAARRKVLKKT